MVYHGPSGGCKACRVRRVKVRIPQVVVDIEKLMLSSAIEANQPATTVFGDSKYAQPMEIRLMAPIDPRTMSFNDESTSTMGLKIPSIQYHAEQFRIMKPRRIFFSQLHQLRLLTKPSNYQPHG